MGGLSGTFALATEALVADEGALQITSNNIANASTPGYSRQVADLQANPTLVGANVDFGQGVSLTGVTGIRNQVVELGLQQSLQGQSQVNTYLQPMNQLQALFNEAQGVGLQTPLSNFFNSLQNLSTNPTDLSLRQAVISAGQTLATAFNQASAGMTQIQAGLNQEIPQAVGQINQMTQQIALINSQVQGLQDGGENASQLIDQRDQLVEQLSGLVGLDNISASDGTITLTTTNGALLVSGTQSFALKTGTGASGNQEVFSQGSDITANLTGGSLGGYIQARDQGLASAQTNLDNLAAGLTSAVNNQQALGTDLNGNPGVPFFKPFTPAGASNANAATQMQVAITDPKLIAASSNGSTGDNGNAIALANILNDPIIDGQTPLNFYSTYVANIGTQVAQATSEQTAQNLVVQQLQTQKSSISGVSLDEESANLIQYQTAYSAAARVVNIISQLAQTAITLGQGG